MQAEMDRAIGAIDDALEEGAAEFTKSYVYVNEEGAPAQPPPMGATVSELPSVEEGTAKAAEIIKRGREIYERRWRERLEKTARGRFVAINILTEDHLLGDVGGTEFDVGRASIARWSEAVPCLVIAVGVPLAA